jgi:hypothetical protein
MTLILDSTNTDDAAGFQGIMDLAETIATAEQINASPLFVAAENYIVAEIPAAALPGGRTHAQRPLIVAALQFLTASYFLMGGGETAHQTEGSDFAGVVESLTETSGKITRTTQYATHSNAISRVALKAMSVADRSEWLRAEAYSLMAIVLGEASGNEIPLMVLVTD